jgi:hypothetical protein
MASPSEGCGCAHLRAGAETRSADVYPYGIPGFLTNSVLFIGWSYKPSGMIQLANRLPSPRSDLLDPGSSRMHGRCGSDSQVDLSSFPAECLRMRIERMECDDPRDFHRSRGDICQWGTRRPAI